MHTYKGSQAVFNHNSDFSGDVVITCGGEMVTIPASDLLDFVAYQYVLPKKISELENMDAASLICGKPD